MHLKGLAKTDVVRAPPRRLKYFKPQPETISVVKRRQTDNFDYQETFEEDANYLSQRNLALLNAESP